LIDGHALRARRVRIHVARIHRRRAARLPGAKQSIRRPSQQQRQHHRCDSLIHAHGFNHILYALPAACPLDVISVSLAETPKNKTPPAIRGVLLHCSPLAASIDSPSKALPETPAASANAKGAAACATLWLQSGEYARGLPRTTAPLPPACARCRHPTQTAS
jgi:hypothetical protein